MGVDEAMFTILIAYAFYLLDEKMILIITSFRSRSVAGGKTLLASVPIHFSINIPSRFHRGHSV